MNEQADKTYLSKTIDGNIAYWKFLKNATAESFKDAFEEFLALVSMKHINRLIVAVEMNDAWEPKIKDLWIKTGEVANQNGIKKWGVVTESHIKKLSVSFLMKGANQATRDYEHYVSDSEEDVLDWIRK